MAALEVSARTLRHWESLGLLSPRRTPGRSRIYDGVQCDRARAVAHLRRLGMSLGEIRRVVEDDGVDTAAARSRIADFLSVRLVAAQDEADRLRAALASLEGSDSPFKTGDATRKTFAASWPAQTRAQR